jgi:hypothetical protein
MQNIGAKWGLECKKKFVLRNVESYWGTKYVNHIILNNKIDN